MSGAPISTIADLAIGAARTAARRRLLRGVSLAVEPGEVRGLVGESGAGKTMIGKAIFDILPRAVAVVGGTRAPRRRRPPRHARRANAAG